MYQPVEVFGTRSSESIKIDRGQVLFGLSGDDFLWAESLDSALNFQKPIFLVGGKGGDRYDASTYNPQSTTIVIDSDAGGTDRVNISGFSDFTIFEGKHLLASNAAYSNNLFVLDAFASVPSIEIYYSSLNEWNTTEFKNRIKNNSSTFLGDYPLEWIWDIKKTGYGLGPNEISQNYTQKEFSELIAYLISKSSQLDPLILPIVRLNISPASPILVEEDGTSNLVFTFTRDGVADAALTINYTLNGTAILNEDYTISSPSATLNTVTFAKGSLEASVTVDPSADSKLEHDETVELAIAAGAGYAIGANASAVGTIRNDETGFNVIASSASVDEGEVLTVTANTTILSSGTLYYLLVGTGIDSKDFTSGGLEGSLFIPTSSSFSRKIELDLMTEGPESLQIKLFSDSARSKQVAVTTVVINDTSRERDDAGGVRPFAKNSFDYKFYNLGGGRYGIQEKGSSKIDEITGASSLKFADQTLTPANDVAATFNQVKGKDDVSGVVFRLYNAAFSRLPDATGLQNWINGNASGNVTYASSAQSFSESQEFKNRYGSNVTDTQFITTLYNNVLGRAPDAAGLSHYQSLLAGGRSRGALLLDFSESPENRVLFTQVTGLA